MKNSGSLRQGALVSCLLLAAAAVPAQDGDVYVPDELEPWRAWVLHGREYRDCPFFFDQTPAAREQAVCAWPGELELGITAEEARFTQPWTVYATDQWVPLPGDGQRWPEGVTSDGVSVTVVLRQSGPAVRLAPGRHVLGGRIGWDERPRSLTVPAETGLIELTVDGRRVARPERAGNDLWLGEREAPARAADTIEVQVWRLVRDDVPTRLTTRFTIEVSGGLREELLEPALPEGFVPTWLESGLPARLEGNGQLRLQVRPGVWEVELGARAEEVRNEVRLPPPVRNLPDTEIWSYRSNDRLRVTAPEGVPPVDPRQVSVPEDFATLPAFRVAAGDSLTLVEQSRGKSGRDDRLELERVLWLDFANGGFTFSDTLRGRLDRAWRLDMAAPYALLNASGGGESLLITRGPEEGLTGIELRNRDLELLAFGRLETRDAVPASGWRARLDGMTAELHLPPGQKLLAAAGADRAPSAWTERWRLLDFFLVLIITLATARMFGRGAGAVAFFALVLSWHEAGAPHWAWLNALAAFALVRVAPPGRLRGTALAYRALSLIALVALLVPFFAGQLRIGIYPELEPQEDQRIALGKAEPARRFAADRAESAAEPAEIGSDVEEVIVTGARSAFERFERFARYAPNAIVQAGPGRPSWRWNTYELYWSGPVDPGRMLDLWILPRWLVTALRFVAVLLALAFGALFVLDMTGRDPRNPRKPLQSPVDGPPPADAQRRREPIIAVLALSLLPLLMPAASRPARAEAPPENVLRELERRLLEPPRCAPRCAEIAAAAIDVTPDALSIVLEVHAAEEVAVPLPGSPDGWRPERIVIDGSAAPPVYRRDGTLWVRTTQGRHRIVLEGALPPVESLEVPFPAAPRVVSTEARGWSLTGIDERRLRTGSLTLRRVRASGESGDGALWESSRFPEFVHVERTIELDVDWRVTTHVYRIAPRQGAITLDVPLIDGASLLTADLPVRDGKVRVSFGPANEVVEWSAALPRRSPLVLHVAEDVPWKEAWRFVIGNVWHAEFSGLPESESEEDWVDIRIAEFHPRGGETLTLEATRPEATAGATLAFDSVTLASDIGARSRTVTLRLAYRSTRGAQHVVHLPEDANLMRVSIDGEQEPLRSEAGELALPILPGEHQVEVVWQEDAGLGAVVDTPPLDLGAAAGNLLLELDLPPSRWVLATSGPRLGPAILYWPELAAMVLFALLLGRTSITPLRARHWLLLGLGFSTFSWPALMLVAVWLLAVGARSRLHIPEERRSWDFNALQIGLALLTLIALVVIVVSVPSGLLGAPDMHVAGNGSYGNHLRWFADRSAGPVPRATAFSLPLWVYKGLILAWALWLSLALLRWLPWVWRTFVSQGIWRRRRAAGDAPA